MAHSSHHLDPECFFAFCCDYFLELYINNSSLESPKEKILTDLTLLTIIFVASTLYRIIIDEYVNNKILIFSDLGFRSYYRFRFNKEILLKKGDEYFGFKKYLKDVCAKDIKMSVLINSKHIEYVKYKKIQ